MSEARRSGCATGGEGPRVDSRFAARTGGSIERAVPLNAPQSGVSRDRNGGFKTFLYAVVRNVALRHEERARSARPGEMPNVADLDQLPVDDDSLYVVFDREWPGRS